MNILIIDDEDLARKIIIEFLQGRNENFNIYEAENTKIASEILLSVSIELIFLDVEMPGENGLDFILDAKFDGKVIFSTAYSEYAVKAFELNAVDYLLKPFTEKRFNSAFDKVISENKATELNLMNDYLQKEKLNERIKIKDGKRIRFFKLSDIIAIEAMGDYVKVIGPNESIIDHHTVTHYEKILPKKYFIRIHRSTIVQIEKIVELRSDETKNKIVLINNKSYDISKSGYDKLKELFL